MFTHLVNRIPLKALAFASVLFIAIFVYGPSVNIVSADSGIDPVGQSCSLWNGYSGCHCVEWNGWFGTCSKWVPNSNTPTNTYVAPTPIPTPQIVAPPTATPSLPNMPINNVTTHTGSSNSNQTYASNVIGGLIVASTGQKEGDTCTTPFTYTADHSLICSADCGNRWRNANAYGCPATQQIFPPVATPTAVPSKTPDPLYLTVNGQQYKLESSAAAAVFAGGTFALRAPGAVAAGETIVATISSVASGIVVGYVVLPTALIGLTVYSFYELGQHPELWNYLEGISNSAAANAIPTASVLVYPTVAVQAIDVPIGNGGVPQPTPPNPREKCADHWELAQDIAEDYQTWGVAMQLQYHQTFMYHLGKIAQYCSGSYKFNPETGEVDLSGLKLPPVQ